MRSSMSYMWLWALLAVPGLLWGPAWAKSRQGVHLVEAGDTRLEVMSEQRLEPGAWVLLRLEEREASRPWWLEQVRSTGTGGLELSSPLEGLSEGASAPPRLLAMPLAWADEIGLRLDALRHVVAAPGSTLPLEGLAQPNAQVLVFINGAEQARWQAEESGWFSGAVELPLVPGEHQLQMVSGVEANWSLHREPMTIVIQAAPPSPVVDEPRSGSFTNDTTPLFRGTAQPGTTVYVTIAGRETASAVVDSAGNWSLSLINPLPQGAYTASIRAESSTGESSSTVTRSFSVDITPPNTTFSAIPGARTSNRNIEIGFQMTEFGTFECSFNGGSFEPCSNPRVLNDLADGRYTFAVRGTDRAGNTDPTPAETEWIVDTVPPDTRITSGPRSRTREQQAEFIIVATEDVGIYECTLNGQPLPSFVCAPRTVLRELSEGSYVFEVRTTDPTGLVDPTPARYEWTVDLTPPPMPVLQQPVAGALLNSQALTLSGTAEPASTVTITISNTQTNTSQTGTVTAAASGSWTFTPAGGLATAPYQIDLEVRDEAGNVNSGFSPVSFRVDVDPPETEIKRPATIVDEPKEQGTRLVSRDRRPRFVFEATDQGAPLLNEDAFICTLNGLEVDCDSLRNGSLTLESTDYKLEVRARDEAGNVDPTPATLEWTYAGESRGSGSGLLVGFGCSAAAGATPLLPLVWLLAWPRRRRTQVTHSAARSGGLLALLLVLLAGQAHAQAVDLQQYKPAPGSHDVLGVYSPRINNSQNWQDWYLSASLNYAQDPLVLRGPATGSALTSVVASQGTLDVMASVAPLSWLELGLAVPVALQGAQDPGDYATRIPAIAAGNGLGDLRLMPKVALPLGTGLEAGLVLPISLPTATGQYLGAAGVGFQPTAMLRWAPTNELSLLANAGARLQPKSRIEVLDLTVGNELTYAAGALWTPSNSPWSARVSLEGANGLSGGVASRPLELLASGGYTLNNGALVQVGGGLGLTSGYGTPSFRLFVSLGGTPPTPRPPLLCAADSALDPDGDSLSNKDDRCPYMAAAAGNGQSTDGCPASPRSAEISGRVALLIQDKDSDGLMDAVDQCVSEAEDVDGFLDDDGCADRDNDKDAIADDKDECRDEPEVKNGYKDEDGCWDDSRLKIARIKDQLIVDDVVFGNGNANLNTASTDRLRKVATALRDAWRGQLEKLGVRGYHRSGQNPSDREQTLLQQRADKVATELGAAEFNLAKPEHSWISSASTFNRNALRIEFTLRQPPAASQVARPLLLALLTAAVGEVKVGASEQELKPLAVQGVVTDGSVLVVAAGGRAEVGLVDGRTLRVAPGSELRLKAGSSKEQPVQLEWVRGWGETDKGVILSASGAQRLEEPKILPACEGSFAQAPRLSWKEVPKASRYQVELARDAEFITDLRLESTKEAHLTPEGLPEGKWYWRVLPVHGEDSVGLPSKVYSFVIEPSKLGRR